uniref:Venom protein 54.1 n=1 Tax=Lychas mucronatus TaxID=172552 RepID=VP54_LYCMC|nr:RecName: Full=Venom protein 54.1; Flags: Precursor [Lychas mucronatus]
MNFQVFSLIFFNFVYYCSCSTFEEALCELEKEERVKVLRCYEENTDPGILLYSKSFLSCLLDERASFITLNEMACGKTFSTNERRACFEEANVFLVNFTEEMKKKHKNAVKKCFDK